MVDHTNELVLLDAERTPCEIWTRVMGYHRPVSAFNRGKQAEHAERRQFVECPAGHRQPSIGYALGGQRGGASE